MIRAAISFFILAIVAYVLGAYGIAGMSVEIGQTLLWIFLIFAVLTYLGPYMLGKKPKKL